jgi:hypothetical protein
MENLNAEQVKKALGSCYPIGATRCKECPYSKNGSVNILFTETHTCYDQMAIDALALINSQEQRIGELTEELTRKETEYNELYELLQTCKADSEAYRSYSKTLEKENEGLKNLLDESFEAQNTVKADTVRKMQERLDKRFCHDPAFLGVEQRLIMDVIDQIAKEMLEGEK